MSCIHRMFRFGAPNSEVTELPSSPGETWAEPAGFAGQEKVSSGFELPQEGLSHPLLHSQECFLPGAGHAGLCPWGDVGLSLPGLCCPQSSLSPGSGVRNKFRNKTGTGPVVQGGQDVLPWPHSHPQPHPGPALPPSQGSVPGLSLVLPSVHKPRGGTWYPFIYKQINVK